MCGIIGYTGSSNDAKNIIINGLRALEYRGYDSAGLALQTTPGYNARLYIERAVGEVDNLVGELADIKSTCGIGHNRWATHGKATVENAHPHYSDDYNIAVVHNGVIDNAEFLRDVLESSGFNFTSETDSEVIVHLLDKYWKKHRDAKVAVRLTMSELSGTYGFVAVFSKIPNALFFARNGSPLIVGIGKSEHYIASDSTALPAHIRDVSYIKDGQFGVITGSSFSLCDEKSVIAPQLEKLKITQVAPSKGQFEHFMTKEIYEQPASITRSFSGRIRKNNVVLDGFNISYLELATTTKVVIIGCGTSYHAGLIACEYIKKFAKVDAHAYMASEFATSDFIPDLNAIYLAVSQSGETFDTIEAVKELLNKGCSVYGIINKVGSTLARLCGKGAYIHAGPEISVASTKAFTGQLATLAMFSIMIGRANSMTDVIGRYYCQSLKLVPNRIDTFLSLISRLSDIKKLATEIADSKYLVFLGRGVNYPCALEGALKMKEIAYIPCDAYAAGEMKHGPIAMIEEGTHVIALVDYEGDSRNRMLNNLEEVRARGANVHVISNNLRGVPDNSMHVKTTHLVTDFTPFVNAVALQLLAYFVAKEKGFDIDKPKNLAKSVTVG